MKKMLTYTFVGLTLSLSSIGVFFLFITSLDTNSNPLLFAASLVLLGLGVFFLIRATSTNVKKLSDPLALVSTSKESGFLEKNNNLLNDWKKTTESEARLKMLQLKADSEDKK